MASIELLKGVRIGGRLYSVGNEQDADDLNKLLTPVQRARLAEAGVITGGRIHVPLDIPRLTEEEDDADDPLPVGIPSRLALIKAGFDTVGKLRDADDEDLLAVDGVGEATLAKIREGLN